MTTEKRDLAMGALVVAGLLLLAAAYHASAAARLGVCDDRPTTQFLQETCHTTKGCRELSAVGRQTFVPACKLVLQGKVSETALRAALQRSASRADAADIDLSTLLTWPIHRE